MPAVGTTVPLYKHKRYSLLELEILNPLWLKPRTSLAFVWFSLIRQKAEFSIWAHLHRILPTIKRKEKSNTTACSNQLLHFVTKQLLETVMPKRILLPSFSLQIMFCVRQCFVLYNEYFQQLLLSFVEISNQKIIKWLNLPSAWDLPTFRLWLQQLLFIFLHSMKSNMFTLFSRTDYH